MSTPDLRQMRYVVEVAEQGTFTRAARNLHVAQQAVSQQIKSVEEQLGLRLFERTSRGVQLTPAGTVFVQEARRVLVGAERLSMRTQAAARGETGLLRLAYTVATVYETLPAIVERARSRHPDVRIQAREVFGGDVERLLRDGRHDLALCPTTDLPSEFDGRRVRREPFAAAVSEHSRLAARDTLKVADLADRALELWPREMSPGYFDAVISICRSAGFEPTLDENASGSAVWSNIAQDNGVGLVVASLTDQLPRGIALIPLEPPAPALQIDLVWERASSGLLIEQFLEAASEVEAARDWE